MLLSDYDPGDSGSPLQSLGNFSASHPSLDLSLTVQNDPLAQVQSIESKNLFTFIKPYKCHIKDKAKSCEALKNDPSNIITASKTFTLMAC